MSNLNNQSKGIDPQKLLFFDNLALFYLINETPPAVLARVCNSADSRLGGSMLGVMTPKQRETIHQLMGREKDDDREKDEQARLAVMIMAQDLIDRGHIEKRGLHFFGLPREQAPPESPAPE